MKHLLLLSLLWSFFLVANGQNLVPNFSFEDYSFCPTTEDQVEFATGWSKYSSNNINTTPDYFNACAPTNGPGVPDNYLLYQADNRNCSAYAGLVTWQTVANSREHIGIQLSEPLSVGEKYYLSLYTVRGGVISGGDYIDSPSNNIGMLLSTVPFTPSDPVPVGNFSHLRSESIISDTLNWIRVSNTLIADSAYNYLILGNFYDDNNTDTTTLDCEFCTNVLSYYLIDDVCVSTDSAMCNGGVELLPCNVSVGEAPLGIQFRIFPNPSNHYLNVNNNLETPYSISIYDVLGQLIYREVAITTNDLRLNISNYADGMLFIRIDSVNNSFTYKLLKQ